MCRVIVLILPIAPTRQSSDRPLLRFADATTPALQTFLPGRITDRSRLLLVVTVPSYTRRWCY